MQRAAVLVPQGAPEADVSGRDLVHLVGDQLRRVRRLPVVLHVLLQDHGPGALLGLGHLDGELLGTPRRLH